MFFRRIQYFDYNWSINASVTLKLRSLFQMASRCFSQAQVLSFQANKPYKVLNREVIKGSLSPNDKFLKRKLTLASRSPLSHSNVLRNEWSSFFSAPNILLPPTRVSANIYHRRNAVAIASWAGTSQIASGAFTLGTAFVIPFYALMVLAPHSEWTKRSMESNIPYVALGALYAYLLCLSWTSETLRLMFASKYWLPELPGITRMFSSDLTVASAWLHLLAVDLFAARQVFRDGLKDGIETRHSIVLCLLFCPIGIMSHIVTKVIVEQQKLIIEDEP